MIQNTRLITTGWSPLTAPSSNKNYTKITGNFADFPVHFTHVFLTKCTPVTVPWTQKFDCPVNTILSDIPLSAPSRIQLRYQLPENKEFLFLKRIFKWNYDHHFMYLT